MATKQMRPERIFVTVTSVFDSTGYVHPREIIWEDGRVFKIESIKDFRPASSLAEHLPGDCYTVNIMLLPPAQSGQTIRYVDDAAKHTRNQAVILFIQIVSELVIFKKVAGYRNHIRAD